MLVGWRGVAANPSDPPACTRQSWQRVRNILVQARFQAEPHLALAEAGANDDKMLGDKRQEMCCAKAPGCSEPHLYGRGPHVSGMPHQIDPETGAAAPRSSRQLGIEFEFTHPSECIINNNRCATCRSLIWQGGRRSRAGPRLSSRCLLTA